MARFQSFWFGSELPPSAHLCLKSFIDHGHAYDLYTYSPVNVPDGVRLVDAEEILPRSEVFFYAHGAGAGSVACFADRFRYRLLMLRGGWWVDTDVVCLSPKIPAGEIFLERESPDLIGSAVIKFPPHHPVVRALYEKSREAGTDLVWGEIGPGLITTLAKQTGLWDQAYLPGRAYPIPHAGAYLLVTKTGRAEAREKTRSAAFLHLWNEIFRRSASTALHHPPNGSFLADLYEKHGVPRRRVPSNLPLLQYSARRLRSAVRSLVRSAGWRVASNPGN